ncbi:MAG: TonB-dependent receptor [Ignavibacteria bacterium]|nr:TonB-dependent receptor [Ignavibacteria bacterium]
MKFTFLLLFALLFHFYFSFSQTASQPLELPNFIIEGKEQIDVQVGTKHMPDYPTYMSRQSMDSISLIEKPRNYVVFPITLPSKVISKKFPDAFILADLGSFITGNINAGYRTFLNEHDIFGFGNLSFSNGHIENSDYIKLNLGAQADFVAPEKFYIFGGSKTTTNVDFAYRSYKIYALDTAPSRNQIDFSSRIHSIGHFEGIDFATGAKFFIVSQSGVKQRLNETLLGGYLKVENILSDINLGAFASLDLRSFDKNSCNFFEFSTFAYYRTDKTKIHPTIGLQFAKPTIGKLRPMFLVQIDVLHHFSTFVEGIFRLSNGLINRGFKDYYQYNPYLGDSLSIDFTNSTEIEGKVKFQPNKDMSVFIGAKFLYQNREPIFLNRTDKFFEIVYLDATVFNFFSEGFLTIDFVGDFSSFVELNFSNNVKSKKDLPYTPTIRWRADFSRNFFEHFRFKINFEYVGERFANLENTVKLASYNNFGFGIDYTLSKSLNIFAEVQNLLNSNVVIWNGFKERGLNFKIGLIYKY